MFMSNEWPRSDPTKVQFIQISFTLIKYPEEYSVNEQENSTTLRTKISLSKK